MNWKYWLIFLLPLGLLFYPIRAAGTNERELQKRIQQLIRTELPRGVRPKIEKLLVKADIPDSASLTLIGPNPPAGIVSFRMTWLENDHIRHETVKAVVKALARVAVARIPIRNEERFTSKNIKFVTRDISAFFHSGFYTRWAPLRALRARGYMRPGVIVQNHQTQRPYAVFRNQLVDYVYRRGRLQIIAKVQALQNGRVEQWIRVRNPRTRKVLHARVEREGRVVAR